MGIKRDKMSEDHGDLLVSPPVGWRVQYLKQGDHKAIYVADVTLTGAHGQVRINSQALGGGTLRSIRDFVRRIDDPHFQKHPEALANSGCWRYLPGMEYQPTKEEVNDAWEHAERQKAARERAEGNQDKNAQRKRVRVKKREESKLEAVGK